MNQALFFYLNNLAGKSVCFDSLVIFVAQYLGYWLVGGLIAFLIFSKDKKRELKMIFFSAFSGFLSRIVITEIIRFFYYVPRPFVNNEVTQLISHEASGSFPSGHAAFFFALAMAVFFFYKKWSILFFLGAILIGFARIIAGVHWPIDILGGAIIGILSAWLVKIFYTAIIKPNA